MNMMTNGETRLWSIWPDGRKVYEDGVVIWRMMWNGGKERVILRARHWKADLIFEFVDGMTMEVIGGKFENPANYNNPSDYKLYRLTNCKARRKWIPQLIAMSSNEVRALDVYLEVDCEIHRYGH